MLFKCPIHLSIRIYLITLSAFIVQITEIGLLPPKLGYRINLMSNELTWFFYVSTFNSIQWIAKSILISYYIWNSMHAAVSFLLSDMICKKRREQIVEEFNSIPDLPVSKRTKRMHTYTYKHEQYILSCMRLPFSKLVDIVCFQLNSGIVKAVFFPISMRNWMVPVAYLHVIFSIASFLAAFSILCKGNA